MANDHGHLPKLAEADLDPRLVERLEAWRRHAYDDSNVFLTMANRPDMFEAVFGMVGYFYGGGSLIEPELAELCRIRLAFKNQCVH